MATPGDQRTHHIKEFKACKYLAIPKDNHKAENSTALNTKDFHRNNFCAKAISRASPTFISCNPAPGLHVSPNTTLIAAIYY